MDLESHHRIGLDADAPAELCLIANGAYLGAAFILPVGDAADLIRLGVPVWAFAVPGVLAFGAGLWVWDGLARDTSDGLGHMTQNHYDHTNETNSAMAATRISDSQW
ncbi:MAG: hypothetical protein ACFHWZ_17240 [Phycisphaerales bacterium]